MARRAPVEDPDLDLGDDLPVDELDEDEPVEAAPDPRQVRRRTDLVMVGVMTPALVIGIFAGIMVLGQTFYPDPYVEPTPVPTRDARVLDGNRQLVAPKPTIVIQPIDTTRLNAGLVEKPPPFDWPEVEELKLVPNPGRPGEQADYTPALANLELRRLIAASTVSVVLHSSPQLAQGAAAELAKAYPLRGGAQSVLDLKAAGGWVPDESAYGVVFTLGSYRVHVETVAASPPLRETQWIEAEGHALHLADHIARRIQEFSSGGRRTGPEAAAVHWRDHLARQLPFGR